MISSDKKLSAEVRSVRTVDGQRPESGEYEVKRKNVGWIHEYRYLAQNLVHHAAAALASRVFSRCVCRRTSNRMFVCANDVNTGALCGRQAINIKKNQAYASTKWILTNITSRHTM